MVRFVLPLMMREELRCIFQCDSNKQSSPITSVLTEGRRRVAATTLFITGFISRARCDRQWENVTYLH